MIIVQLDSDQLSDLIQSSVRTVLKEIPPKLKEQINHSDELLTIDEIAKLLHLSKATIYSKNSKGQLPGVCKRGKILLFQRQIIVDWVKGGRKKTNEELAEEANTFLSNKKKGQKS